MGLQEFYSLTVSLIENLSSTNAVFRRITKYLKERHISFEICYINKVDHLGFYGELGNHIKLKEEIKAGPLYELSIGLKSEMI